jgi:hypothetical protein
MPCKESVEVRLQRTIGAGTKLKEQVLLAVRFQSGDCEMTHSRKIDGEPEAAPSVCTLFIELNQLTQWNRRKVLLPPEEPALWLSINKRK